MLGLAPGTVAIVMGTRPEAIKLSEIVRLLGAAALPIHTGQHYSADLWSAVAADIGLPHVATAASVGGQFRATQIGDAVTALGAMFRATKSIRAVLVQGDTNATLAGALAANAESLPLLHVEAGLRSHDRRMPEEHNRVLVDHLSDICFAPTLDACSNLAAENIDAARIVLTGNTVVEAVRRMLPMPPARRDFCRQHRVEPRRYVLATIHRPENTDDQTRLAAILADLRSLDVPVVLPLHPRTRQAAAPAWLRGLNVVDPLPPREFLALLAESALAISDSGGVQEEATVLGCAVLIVRRSTERPEALGRWSELVQPGNSLRSRAQERLAGVDRWRSLCSAPSPYGDGTASHQIVDALSLLLDAPLAYAA